MPTPPTPAPSAEPLVDVTLFTDPACPFAFSAEPVRWTLRWQYGDQLRWTPTMIVLTREDGEAEKLASGADGLQRAHGMPIARGPHERPASSEPACRAVVATRLHDPARAEALLRRLRVRTMAGGLLDDPDLLAAAATDVGLDPGELAGWIDDPRTAEALEGDATAARAPSDRALALGHRLGGPDGEPRYSAPSMELRRVDGTGTAVVPGFNPIATYEVALANLEPRLVRRDPPEDALALLRWAGEPLATAEVAAVLRIEIDDARGRLDGVAERTDAGADAYWTAPAA